VLGGIALGIGYISPVSTLIKWFPDRPGMATGMAIMGFGGGALIASPLSVWLMAKFSTPTHVGVMETFVVLGAVYLIFMLVGAAIVRVPPMGWKPEGFVPPQENKLISQNDVYVYDALKTPQFWLIWCLLCVNVTAGIGVLGQASAMSQEMFPDRIAYRRRRSGRADEPFQHGWALRLGHDVGLYRPPKHLFHLHGAGFRPLLSGPLDRFHRLGHGVRAVLSGHHFNVWGGFSTVPAYLKDMFGTRAMSARFTGCF
jgi:hypothetical protein